MSATTQTRNAAQQAHGRMSAKRQRPISNEEARDVKSAPTQTTNADERPLTLAQSLTGLLRKYLGGRHGVIVLAIAVLAAGAYFNWGWLVAAGIAPLILAFAPCAAMCALGICMSRMGGKSCFTDAKAGADLKTIAARQIDAGDASKA